MIRAATASDWPAIWWILEPIFRDGSTYAVDQNISEAESRLMWLEAPAATFVAEEGSQILGTYYIKTNHAGRAAHICNCGYMTANAARGRGLATAMCLHSQNAARALGYRSMQFNMVMASNAGAVRLWQKLGFDIVGTLPRAFDHPEHGFVDAHVMWRDLTTG